jgi:hypothetical protein
MILSLSHRFIFVHVPKTAGWSMMDTLRPYARPEPKTLWRSLTRRLSVVESPERAHFRVHETARWMIAKLSRPVWDSFISFAVVRDPFQHAVSHYEYLKQHRSASVARRFQSMSFEAYLADRQRRPFLKHTIFVRMPDQAHFLLDAGGRIAVSRILRFEMLAAEWAQLVADIGLPGLPLLHVNRTKAKSDRKPYTAYYTPETEETVRRLYRRDFALFGYPDRLPAPQGS